MSTTADELLISEKKLTDELVTHEAIMRQLLMHEDRIIKNMDSLNSVSHDLSGARKDIHDIKSAIGPIVQAVKSLCWLMRGVLILGMVAGAGVAFIEFYDHLPIG